MPISNALKSLALIAKTKSIQICALVLLFSTQSYASCPKEDVAFYLKQGFNHDQIVKMCSTPNSIVKQRTISPERLQPRSYSSDKQYKSDSILNKQTRHSNIDHTYRHESSGTYGNPDAIFLATAVEAYDVEVTDDAIMFTRKDCFDFGKEDWNGFQNRACPNVKYTVVRGGLKIVERDNGFFGLGSTALYISGNITAEILDLDQFNAKFHKSIRSTILTNTEKLKIDVRSGMPQSKVEAILLKLAG